jgi:phosphohistidine phosphatase
MSAVPARSPTDRRQLLLLRHAKSSWDNPMLPDHDRPLAPRGSKALKRLGQQLRSWGVSPDLVLCSSARRAVETLDGIRSALPPETRVVVDEGLYGSSVDALLRRLGQAGDDIGCLLVVGHNPTLEDLANLLAGAGKRSLRNELAMKFPTASLALLSFEGGWSQLEPGRATLEQLFKPRKGG